MSIGIAIAASADSAPAERPAASSLSMLDRFVTAIVVGPVSLSPPEWICPLLGVTPDAFNHDNEEFAAIAATAMRFNLIGEALVQTPDRYAPLLTHADGVVDARPWCEGFYAAMKLRLLAWSLLMSQHSIENRLLLPILFRCRDDKGWPFLPSTTRALAHEAWRDIRAVVTTLRQFWQPSRYPRGA
jgi:yecA family protein